MARVKGYVVSDEERAKISAALKERYAAIRERLALLDRLEQQYDFSEEGKNDNGQEE
jgi:hypothetical protein